MVGKKLIASVVMSVGLALLTGGFSGCKPKAKKQFNEACKEDTECESLECSPFGGICSKDCTYDKDCGGDLVCRQKDETGAFCSKAVGNPPNGSCMQGSECSNGMCLHRIGQEDQPGICSKNCGGPDDCPAGMKICDSISDSGALKVCLPGDASAPADQRPKFSPPKKPTVKLTATPTVTTPPKPTATTPLGAPTTVATTSAAPVVSAKPPIGALKPPPPPPKKGH